MDAENIIKKFHRGIYDGPNGSKRKKLVVLYKKTNDSIWESATENFVRRLEFQGKTVSCKKGCIHCCYHHTQTNLAHALVVIDYLHQRDDILRRFLRNYWRLDSSATDIATRIDDSLVMDIENVMHSSRVTETTKSLQTEYIDLQVACPFLIESACGIYPVRPRCCASHLSTYPPEWCAKNDTHEFSTDEIVLPPDGVFRLASLGDRVLDLYQISTPRIVYDLITRGADIVYAQAQKTLSRLS